MTRLPASFFASVKARTALRKSTAKTVWQTARNLYDFTVSAPKALSVQALEDPRLIAAHNTAVAETAQEMERVAGDAHPEVWRERQPAHFESGHRPL